MEIIGVPFKAAIGRSSKNLITDKQSMHAVMNNDDLLIEILLRLPVILLLQLKYVCKRWISLIADPTFTLRRSRIPTLDPPCGALIGKHALSSSGEYYFLSFYPRSFPLVSKLRGVEILITQSCNGLFLCCSKTNANQYYVYNPSINIRKMVPRCSIGTVKYGDSGTRIAFDPTKSPHYKVIQVVVTLSFDTGYIYSVQIQTYSSETDMWTACTCPCPCYSFYTFYEGIYWNDAIYWLYDHNVLCIKSGDPTLKTINSPQKMKHVYRDSKLFETCGCLLLLCRKSDMLMDVYEMRKEDSEWVVKYRVNLNEDVSCPRRSWLFPSVYTIVLGEREDDSFIVVEDSKKIFKYKLVLKSSHHLYDLKSLQNFYCFQFIASFAGVGL